jgi:hypothetical protein
MVILAPEFISKEHPAYEYQLAMERHNSDDLLLGSSSQPAEQHSAEDHKSLYVPWGAVEETITLSSELYTIKSKLPAVKSAEPVQPCKCARVGPDWDYDVFLCHEGRSSKQFATKIFNALADKQIRAFLDKVCFRGSQTVPSTLAKSIYKSHFVMVILAPEFISKEHPAYEYQLAMERHNSDDLLLGSSSQPAEQHSAEDHKSLYVPWGAVEETITLSSELYTIKSKLPAVKSAEPVQPYKCARIGPDWDYDVFLCHEGRSSKEFATKIFNALADKQIRAFLDKVCFRGSQTVPSTLAKSIYKSQSIYKSRFVMVILAPEFISKEHPAYEYQLAMERHNSDDLLLGSSSQPAEQHSAEDHKSFVTQTMEGDMTKHIDEKQILAVSQLNVA